MRISRFIDEWRATLLVAAVYVYFLIFAQFAFLARLVELGIIGSGLNIVLAAMAGGGILFSLLTPRARRIPSAALRLRIGLGVSGVAALGALLTLNEAGAAVIAFLIGSGLGIVTVTLATYLRAWTGARHQILKVGLGAGLGYFICNVPAVFAARPVQQSAFAALLIFWCGALPLRMASDSGESRSTDGRHTSFPVILTSFFALVWLDSAAFYIIQHSSKLRAATWLGAGHLWTNAGLHLVGAIIAAHLLRRRQAALVLACAFGALGFACVLLLHPILIPSASLFYPVGVSFYSVALVAYPSFLASANSIGERGRQAGWLYAVAGWVGSSMGIGMGQNLGKVPTTFVAASGLVVLGPMLLSLAKRRTREVAPLGSAMAVALLIDLTLLPGARVDSSSAIERGRRVYISEGCISCHSQYVRPGSADVLIWGPSQTMEEVHALQPPLIGNRRQGPDLSQVGSRRSKLWLEAHLVDPREISYRSIMPSYAFLFSDQRGDDLVAYLASLRSPAQQHLEEQRAWQPSASAMRSADFQEGRMTYEHNCATCHDRNGAAREHLHASFKKLPPDLAAMGSSLGYCSSIHLAQVIKFGIPGTDMPGHEYLSDGEIASLALWLKRSYTQPLPHS